MGKYYLLREKTVVPCSNDVEEWIELFQAGFHRILTDSINNASVHTVFLGMDAQKQKGLPPLLFRTMLWGGGLGVLKWTHSTYEEAEAMHHKVVAAIRENA